MSNAGFDALSSACGGLLTRSDCPDFANLENAAILSQQPDWRALPVFSELFFSAHPNKQLPPPAQIPPDPHLATRSSPVDLAPRITRREDGGIAVAAGRLVERLTAAHTAPPSPFEDNWRNLAYGAKVPQKLSAIRHMIGFSGREPTEKYEDLKLKVNASEAVRPTALQRMLDPKDVVPSLELNARQSGRVVQDIKANRKSDGEAVGASLGNEAEQMLYAKLEEGVAANPVQFKYNGSTVLRFIVFVANAIFCIGTLGLGAFLNLYGRFKWAHMVKNSEWETDKESSFYLMGGPRYPLHPCYGYTAGSCVCNGLEVIVHNACNYAKLRAAVELSYNYDHKKEGLIAMLATTNKEALIDVLHNAIKSRQGVSDMFEHNDFVQRKVAESIYNAMVAGTEEVMNKGRAAVAEEYKQSFCQHMSRYLDVMKANTAFASKENRQVQWHGKHMDYFAYLREVVADSQFLDDAQKAELMVNITTAEGEANKARASYDARRTVMGRVEFLARQLAGHPEQAGAVLESIQPARTSFSRESSPALLDSDRIRLEGSLSKVQAGAEHCAEIVRLASGVGQRIEEAETDEAVIAADREFQEFIRRTTPTELVLNSDEFHGGGADAVDFNTQTKLRLRETVIGPLTRLVGPKISSLRDREAISGAVKAMSAEFDGAASLADNVTRLTGRILTKRREITENRNLLPAHREALLAQLATKQGELANGLMSKFLDSVGDVSLFYQKAVIQDQIQRLDNSHPYLRLARLFRDLTAERDLAARGRAVNDRALAAGEYTLATYWPAVSERYPQLVRDMVNLAVDRSLLENAGRGMPEGGSNPVLAGQILAKIQQYSQGHIGPDWTIDRLIALVGARKQAGASRRGMAEVQARIEAVMSYDEARAELGAVRDQLSQGGRSGRTAAVVDKKVIEAGLQRLFDKPRGSNEREDLEIFAQLARAGRGVDSVEALDALVRDRLGEHATCVRPAAMLLADIARTMAEQNRINRQARPGSLLARL